MLIRVSYFGLRSRSQWEKYSNDNPSQCKGITKKNSFNSQKSSHSQYIHNYNKKLIIATINIQ